MVQRSAEPAAGSYHPDRLLVTLHSPPRMRDAHSDHLPDGLDLDHVIDNSHAGDGHARAAPRPEDLIFVAGITNGIDAADMLKTTQDHPGGLRCALKLVLCHHDQRQNYRKTAGGRRRSIPKLSVRSSGTIQPSC